MTSKSLQTFLTICGSLILISCRDNTLVGKWKIQQVVFLGEGGYEGPIELNNKDSLDSLLGSHNWRHLKSNQIDSLASVLVSSYLELNPDSTFKLVDGGSLIRDTLGWFAAGQAAGKWSFDRPTKLITLQINPRWYKQYKLLKVTPSELVLGEFFSEKFIGTKTKLIRQ